MRMEEELRVDVADGKYTFIYSQHDWRIHIHRHGEPWIVLEQGHKAILPLMQELDDCRGVLNHINGGG